MLGPRESRRRARLIVIFEEACQPILIVEPGPQMGANGADIRMAETRVKPLVVTIVEALLLQFPFEVPIGLGQKGEARVCTAHGPYGSRPEREGINAPRASEYFWQDEHRHVAADTVALIGDRE